MWSSLRIKSERLFSIPCMYLLQRPDPDYWPFNSSLHCPPPSCIGIVWKKPTASIRGENKLLLKCSVGRLLVHSCWAGAAGSNSVVPNKGCLSGKKYSVAWLNSQQFFKTHHCVKNECRNSIRMVGHYHLVFLTGHACCKENLFQPITSTTQIWVVTCHQYGISSLIPQMSSRKCQLFSKATL